MLLRNYVLFYHEYVQLYIISFPYPSRKKRLAKVNWSNLLCKLNYSARYLNEVSSVYRFIF